MFFARRTIQAIKVCTIVVAAYALLVMLLAYFAPVTGATFQQAFLRWFTGIPATLLTWFVLEWLGTTLVNQPFWSRMRSWARIALMVSIIVTVTVVVVAASVWWHANSAA
jgi:ABC-type dipeptide/oligopeptide/nickel transport system permease subunit